MSDQIDAAGDVQATLSGLESLGGTMQQLQKSSDAFGRAISGGLARGIVEGRRLDDVLKSVGRSLVQSTLKSALTPLFSGIGQSLSSGLSGLFQGGGTAAAAAPVVPFADGGVIASPAHFPMGRQMGLMGERGAEAILPLARGADGKLGVQAGGGRAASVTVNIAASDAESFRRSEAQVSAAIARAVARGQRAL